ncbi:SulP family inorganic anion transporter [Rhodoglobus aureus]|uniref:SulP family inorganic anion transporter n=2 Tax=Rhodoglobus aureus TaxID=191497 RepID=A0ABP4GKZ2_9MICO
MVAVYGVENVLPTVLLAGIIQVAFGLSGMARVVRFIPRSVMLRFVNALGVLIFMAQVGNLLNVDWPVYVIGMITLIIVVLLPRFTEAVPAPLVAIVLITAATMIFGINVPTVGNEGNISGVLPGLTPLLVPLNINTLGIVGPTALGVAFVGVLESLLTAKMVDDITDSQSSKGRESWALGVANILAGLYGGVAGCAMVGQTVMNVKLGRARTRLSTLVAGVFLLVLAVVISPLMEAPPMSALAVVMMIVAVCTVNWHSVHPATLRRMPVPETLVMVSTIIVTVATENLAIGIGVGVLLAMMLFARRVAAVTEVDRLLDASGQVVRYHVRGPLFFATSNVLVEQFHHAEDPNRIIIDMPESHVWDASSVAARDAIATKYAARSASVDIQGLNDHSHGFHGRLTGRLNDD